MITISTHILDHTSGTPARDVEVQLYDDNGNLITTVRTDGDGRAGHLAEEVSLSNGTYELRFQTGAYFSSRSLETFFPEVSIRFAARADGEHFHVPLLLSPYGYSTYRGS